MATIESVNKNLRLNFSYQGKQYRWALGIRDTVKGRNQAQKYLERLESDLNNDLFKLENRDNYRPVKKVKVEEPTTLSNVSELWELFLKDKFRTLKEKSKQAYLENQSTLAKSGILSLKIKDIKPSDIKERLLRLTTDDRARRILMQLSACFDFGVDNDYVKTNPVKKLYKSFASMVVYNEAEPNPLTKYEMLEVINAFKASPHGISFYTDFVKFLFLTGCRPSEAIGLTWGQIKIDDKTNLGVILFDGSIVRVSGKAVRNEGSKTNKIREYPIEESFIKELYGTLREANRFKPSDLVFCHGENKPINYDYFSKHIWKPITHKLGLNVTPYCCRDTFISLCVNEGISIEEIALWVDNSPMIIRKHYLSLKRISKNRSPDLLG